MPVQRSSSFTPRGKQRGDKLAVFDNMRQNGAGWGEALFSIIRGHQMTEEQAAICIQAYWRRYAAIIHRQEERGAAITIQAAFRGHDLRRMNAEQAAAAARVHARLLESLNHTSMTGHDHYHAISKLQAAWRAHLARASVARMRQKKIKRTFSWSKRATPAKKANKPPQRQGRAESSRLEGPATPRIKRSLSFDRFTRPWTGNREANKSPDGKPEPADSKKRPPTVSKQLLFILLHRGPTGLGLELDATNTIINIIKGGAADRQGYFMVGDTIASVDGIPLRGRLLQDVMDRSKNSYSFDVWRLRTIEPEEATKTSKPVRRAFSFDRKKR
ncbi:hypothetical protein AB1Y20_000485 [Prymnesium parvum]|uniref:PDZ domain-containing protein n=1 Tax=Prymnesium parvum TaxID=97485 RepID=A0AB34KA79_PRYPA|mmetsp:Transcript_26810/g.66343  ORF Transcript_26810/g.66343 Transcript_26810/m.66343 type:complete len:330 (+) Transcript_26810:92-1081(+)